MSWFRQFLSLNVLRGNRGTEESVGAVEACGIEDIDMYIKNYIDNFYVNVDYAGDQRDHGLLERIRGDASGQGDVLVLSVLLRGVDELRSRRIESSFEGRSIFCAIRELGDKAAIDPLRLLLKGYGDVGGQDSPSRSGHDVVVYTLFVLGDVNWIREEVALTNLVEILVRAKVNCRGKWGTRYQLGRDATVEASRLLERDGDFGIRLETRPTGRFWTEQEVVVEAISQ
ncbi:MAG: hypothetical protein Rubg2KO_17960 [Rubricoccaceae bacterium]